MQSNGSQDPRAHRRFPQLFLPIAGNAGATNACDFGIAESQSANELDSDSRDPRAHGRFPQPMQPSSSTGDQQNKLDNDARDPRARRRFSQLTQPSSSARDQQNEGNRPAINFDDEDGDDVGIGQSME